MFLGTTLLSRFGHDPDKHRLIESGLFVVAAALMVLGIMRPVGDFIAGLMSGASDAAPEAATSALVAVVMVTGLVAGVGFVAVIVASQTIIQEHVPVAVRGRVFAVQLMLSNVVSILPLLFMGGLADVIGVGRTLILLALSMLAVGLLTIRYHRRLPSV
jgi:MFS transporter, DHA3 family, macrolide efflux protein